MVVWSKFVWWWVDWHFSSQLSYCSSIIQNFRKVWEICRGLLMVLECYMWNGLIGFYSCEIGFSNFQNLFIVIEIEIVLCWIILKIFYLFFWVWLRKNSYNSTSTNINSLSHSPNLKRPPRKEASENTRENEKMLITSIFCFSQNVFSPFRIKFQFLSRIYRLQ